MKEYWLSNKLKPLFGLGLIAAFVFYVRGLKYKRFDEQRKLLWNSALFVTAFMVIFVSVYTARPNGNLGVRFFACVFSFVFLFMAAAFDKIVCGLFSDERRRDICVVAACVFLLCVILPRVNFANRDDMYDFISFAEYLRNQKDLRDDDVVVYRCHLGMGCNCATRGWYEYCLGGEESGVNLSYEADEKKLDGTRKVYVFHSEIDAPLNFCDEYTKNTLERDFDLTERIPLETNPELNEIRVYERKQR
jgi:hypothetical protein